MERKLMKEVNQLRVQLEKTIAKQRAVFCLDGWKQVAKGLERWGIAIVPKALSGKMPLDPKEFTRETVAAPVRYTVLWDKDGDEKWVEPWDDSAAHPSDLWDGDGVLIWLPEEITEDDMELDPAVPRFVNSALVKAAGGLESFCNAMAMCNRDLLVMAEEHSPTLKEQGSDGYASDDTMWQGEDGGERLARLCEVKFEVIKRIEGAFEDMFMPEKGTGAGVGAGAGAGAGSSTDRPKKRARNLE